MKRSANNLELPVQKRQKQLKPFFKIFGGDSTIMSKIFGHWFDDRIDTLERMYDNRDAYDWLLVQTISAFYRDDYPWHLSHSKMKQMMKICSQEIPKAKFLRYTVLTQHQRRFYDNVWGRYNLSHGLDNNITHIMHIVSEYQLTNIVWKMCSGKCSTFTKKCRNPAITLINFATTYFNLPLWRRLLSVKIAGLVPLAQILRQVEYYVGEQSPPEKFKFLSALQTKCISLPAPILEISKEIYEDIMDSCCEEEDLRFHIALAIIFQKHGLDFYFWRSGNLEFIEEEITNY